MPLNAVEPTISFILFFFLGGGGGGGGGGAGVIPSGSCARVWLCSDSAISIESVFHSKVHINALV